MSWRIDHARAEASGCLAEQCAEDEERTRPVTNCWVSQDNDDDDELVNQGLDDEERSRLLELQATFWKEREAEDCWIVPMGRDLEAMPWLPNRTVGILEAIRRARKAGKIALLVDNSRHRVVDTFFSYRSVQIIEAKQLILEERTGKRSRAQVLELALPLSLE